MKRFLTTGNIYVSLLMIVILFGCQNDRSSPKVNPSESRLIVIAMDFSESTVNSDIRKREIEVINKLKHCFKAGDTIYLYQITNKSFKEPKRIGNLKIPYPGRLETEAQVLKKYKNIYKNLLRQNFQEILKLSYPGTDISGFLLFVEREFNVKDSRKILIVISDGIESTDHLNPEHFIAYGVKDILKLFEDKKYMTKLDNWQVVRTGLWLNVSAQLMKMYDEFWKEYFSQAKASYKRIGFDLFEGNPCEAFEGE